MVAHSEDWNDDLPRFGRAGRRWFRQRVHTYALGWVLQYTQLDPQLERAHRILAEMVHQLTTADARRDLLQWKDDEQFRGPDYSNGAWQIDTKGLLERLPNVFEAAGDAVRAAESRAALAIEAARYPTLDAWLGALHRNELDERAGPAERDAGEFLDDAGAERWYKELDRQDALQGIAPPPFVASPKGARGSVERCVECGKDFALDREKGVRCPACRAAREERQCRVCRKTFLVRPTHYARESPTRTCPRCKAEKKQRCIYCKRLFTVESHKTRSCAKCSRAREELRALQEKRRRDD